MSDEKGSSDVQKRTKRVTEALKGFHGVGKKCEEKAIGGAGHYSH